MAQVWQCDRCEVISKAGDIDGPPDGWERRTMPVRGSQGARSSMDVVICMECDDDLYLWVNRGWMMAEQRHAAAEMPQRPDPAVDRGY